MNGAPSDLQGGAVVARLVHTQEVAGSIPAPASSSAGVGPADHEQQRRGVSSCTPATAARVRPRRARLIYLHPELPGATFSSGWMDRSRIAGFWNYLVKRTGVTVGHTELR